MWTPSSRALSINKKDSQDRTNITPQIYGNSHLDTVGRTILLASLPWETMLAASSHSKEDPQTGLLDVDWPSLPN